MTFISAVFLSIFLISCSSTSNSTSSEYPDITTFISNPTDQFIVDFDSSFVDGHMFRGEYSLVPHTGAHVNFIDNASGSTYPADTAPSEYPPIYAIADGTITAIEPYYEVDNNGSIHYRYGIYLSFASYDSDTIAMQYSIEPMVDPGDSSFYEDFIVVSVGDTVSKGDVIGYMYLSTDESIGTDHHIHFSLTNINTSTFYPPAIFTDELMDAFLAQISGQVHNYDGGPSTGNWMGKCMGYEISADENPYENSADSCLE